MSGASAKENTGTRKEPWIKRKRRDSWLCFLDKLHKIKKLIEKKFVYLSE